jgi:hypothetical protein
VVTSINQTENLFFITLLLWFVLRPMTAALLGRNSAMKGNLDPNLMSIVVTGPLLKPLLAASGHARPIGFEA